MQSTFVLDPPSPGISIINFQGMPVTPSATIHWNFCQGLQILLISDFCFTNLESFWNIWSQVSDFPARGPGRCTLFFLQISAEGEFFICYKEGCDEQALK